LRPPVCAEEITGTGGLLKEMMSNPERTLYLIDGSGFIFRAFYALPPLNRPDGTPVNAVLGFCNILTRLHNEVKAKHAAVIFDAGRKTFRNEIYTEYKAHRPEPPDELKPQFSIVREAAKAFGFPSIELPGFEADDLMASYAKAAREKNWDVVIVSSDKDMFQLVKDGVTMYDPIKNKPLNDEQIFEKFGVTPDKIIDVQSLIGDKTDNVPGAPGIGGVTAAKLINEFGTLDNLLAKAGEIKQNKCRETVIKYADQIRMSRKLVTLSEDCPLPMPVQDLEVRENSEQLGVFLQAQGFRKLMERLGKKEDFSPTPPMVDPSTPVSPGVPATAPPEIYRAPFARAVIDAPQHYELVQDIKDLQRWVDAARKQGYVAVDTETDSLTASTAKLVGVSLALEPGKACYIPLNHIGGKGTAKTGELDLSMGERPRQIGVQAAIDVLKPLLEDLTVLKIGHNLKYDWQVLLQHGIRIAPVEDTMLLSFVMDAGKHGHGLDGLAEMHLQHKMIGYTDVTGKGKEQIGFAEVPLDVACNYAAEDADFTLRLWHVLKPRVEAEHMINLYERFERPMVRATALMETAGVKIDLKTLRDLSEDFTRRLADLETDIIKEVGQPFNIGSPKQLGEILFDKMGLPGGKKGKTGAYSTSSDVLEPLAEQGHSIVAKILDWRGLSKLRSTYTDALQEQIDARTGRVHTSFSLVGAATGRLSSTDPNLQNIPIRTEDGRNIRRAFVAEEGFTLLSADYSQIELRLAAEMADVKALKEAFQEGVDIHAKTAAEVFGVPLAHVTPEQRRQAKAINFGIIYGISGFGLAKQIGCTPAEGGAFVRDYLSRFPEIRDFMETQKQKARDKGYVETLYGRRCNIRGINDKMAGIRAGAERQAINAPLQGTAADIMKRAMIRLSDVLQENKMRTRMILQVHDELLFEVPTAEKEAAAQLAKSLMEGAAHLSVPLVVETGFGKSWAEAH
jgi:DNA polymerase-1